MSNAAPPAPRRVHIGGESYVVECAVLDFADETAWLAAERYGASRSCEGCRKVMRHIDKRGDAYVCAIHHRAGRVSRAATERHDTTGPTKESRAASPTKSLF